MCSFRVDSLVSQFLRSNLSILPFGCWVICGLNFNPGESSIRHEMSFAGNNRLIMRRRDKLNVIESLRVTRKNTAFRGESVMIERKISCFSTMIRKVQDEASRKSVTTRERLFL